MKQTWIIGGILFVSGAAVANAGGEIGNGYPSEEYFNSTAGFGLTYPVEWDLLSTDVSVHVEAPAEFKRAGSLSVAVRGAEEVNDPQDLLSYALLWRPQGQWQIGKFHGLDCVESRMNGKREILIYREPGVVLSVAHTITWDRPVADRIDAMLKSLRLE